jgi:Tfp pilus assembly protein PilF
MSTGPENGVTVQHARQHLMAGHASEAIQELRSLLQQDAENAEAYELMGAALTMAGNKDGGLACFERACELKPERASYHYNFGCALEKLDDPMRAIAQFRLAVQADPNYTRASEAVRRVEMALLTPKGHTLSEH